MEVIGKIIHVYPTEAKSEKFRVQEFVCLYQESTSKRYCFNAQTTGAASRTSF
jgi:hypothetical protein